MKSKAFFGKMLAAALTFGFVLMLFLAGCPTGDDGGGNGGGGGGGKVPTVTVTQDDAKLVVQWTAVTDAKYYQVVWGAGLVNPPDPLNVTNSTDNIPGTTYTIRGLQNGISYAVWVRGKRADSTYTDYSEKQNATPTVSDEKPGKPVVTVTPEPNGEITINWTAARWATSYDVKVGVATDVAEANTIRWDVDTNTLEYTTNNNLPEGGPKYYVWVVAKNQTQTGTPQSTNSDPKQVTIVESPVDKAALANTTWKSGAGATFVFNNNDTLVYTSSTGTKQDGSYNYVRNNGNGALTLTVGDNGNPVQVTVKGKTFNYSNATFTRQ
jgi:hypothetical protein